MQGKELHCAVMRTSRVKAASSQNDKGTISIQREDRKWIDSMKDTREGEEGSRASSGDTKHVSLHVNVNRVPRAANIQKPSELQSHAQIKHLLPHSALEN